jgi:hypothetical protein
MKPPKIIVLGNYKPSGHSCGKVHDVGGVSSTIMENHGAVIAILEIDEDIEDSPSNETGIH